MDQPTVKFIYLLTGNHRQAIDWCYDRDINPNGRNPRVVILLERQDQPRGRHFVSDVDEFHKVGTWYERRDLNDMRMVLAACSFPIEDLP